MHDMLSKIGLFFLVPLMSLLAAFVCRDHGVAFIRIIQHSYMSKGHVLNICATAIRSLDAHACQRISSPELSADERHSTALDMEAAATALQI